jgi:hypothetical protein
VCSARLNLLAAGVHNDEVTFMEMFMRMHMLAAAAGLAMLTPFAALAQEPAGAAQEPANTGQIAPMAQPIAAIKPAGNPIVCEYYYYEGTVIRRPDCRTLHQWERQRYVEQRFVEELEN